MGSKSVLFSSLGWVSLTSRLISPLGICSRLKSVATSSSSKGKSHSTLPSIFDVSVLLVLSFFRLQSRHEASLFCTYLGVLVTSTLLGHCEDRLSWHFEQFPMALGQLLNLGGHSLPSDVRDLLQQNKKNRQAFGPRRRLFHLHSRT